MQDLPTRTADQVELPAAARVLAPRTVEWTRSKIYAKLGIRSRSELAGRLAPDESANKGGFEG